MKTALRLVPAAALASLSVPAFAAGATGPDFTALTDAVDFGTTSDAILSVGAVAIGLTLVVLGIRKVMQMIRAS